MRPRWWSEFRAGKEMTSGDAEVLRSALESDPGNVGVRVRLLGYCSRQHDSDVADSEAANHIKWFIEHDPECDVFVMASVSGPYFAEVRDAWDRALAAEDVTPLAILRAAEFFRWTYLERRRVLLERGERLAPTWPDWPTLLGGDAMLRLTLDASSLSEGAKLALAEEALSHFTRAVSAPSEGALNLPRCSLLALCAEASLACERLAETIQFAKDAIAAAADCSDEWERVFAPHFAHGILGHAALETGDVAGARHSLDSSGTVMMSFARAHEGAPDFTLAQRLLDLGERDVVRRFLNDCAAWSPDRTTLWQQRIDRGVAFRLSTFRDELSSEEAAVFPGLVKHWPTF